MDGETSIQQEYSRVLADLVVYYIEAPGIIKEAAVRQRAGVARWSDRSDEALLLVIGDMSRVAKRQTPDRNRIEMMAKIRYLAGSDAAGYGNRLFSLSNEQLQGIHDRLLVNRSKAAALPSSADYDDRPVKAGATGQVSFPDYKAWRFSAKGRKAFRLGEEETEEEIALGTSRWGVKALFEKLRRKSGLGAFENGWNNNWTAAFGRDLKETHPEWPKEFFETRASVSDAWPRITGQMVNSIPASF
jgi:hypothetical protein